MAHPSSTEVRDWLSVKLDDLWPLALGSLSLRRSPCTRARCRTCESGEQHRSYVLYGRRGGRRFALYVPAELVPEVRRALANGRRLQQLLNDVGYRWVQARKTERKVPGA